MYARLCAQVMLFVCRPVDRHSSDNLCYCSGEQCLVALSFKYLVMQDPQDLMYLFMA